MPNNSLLRNSFFVAGSVLVGLAIALVAMRLWPQLVQRAPATDIASTTVPAPPQAQGAPDAALASPVVAPISTLESATADDALLAESINGSFAPAVRASAPAVVSIYTRHADDLPATPFEQMFGNPRRRLIQQKLGSGVIVDSAGHIVTNNHVVERSDEIFVQLADSRVARAKLVGSDPDTDIAILKAELSGLPVMQLGRSNRVAVGYIVLSIGTPFGFLAQTVTHGIVSATGRADLGVATFEDFIQTDAAINDGNSGGALVNMRGELIGINTAVLGKEEGAAGLSIAIPVDLVRGVMSEILEHGRVIRGSIGIEVTDLSAEEARDYGLPHAGVAINPDEDSPAAAAGLRFGDIIESIDGEKVSSAQDVRARIASHKPGSKVRLAVDRGTRRVRAEAQVVEAPRRQQP